jgi:outer membrane receptor for ferrienterochelin and colicin
MARFYCVARSENFTDDKPVELDKQLQDLISMPGSMIEKIEVMTTAAQYANERGGVINIVTKKLRLV